MSWLRIDDGFAEHYKISELSDREFRVWVRILCYAARNNGRAGRLTRSMRKEIVGLTTPMCRRFIALGLLDPDDEEGVVAVHDWRAYNPKDPTGAERAKRYRDRDETVTEPLQERDDDRDANGPSRVGARARPVPSPTPTPEEPDALGTTAVLLEAGSSAATAAENSTFDPNDYNRADPVLRLLAALADRDEGTENVLRSFRLPEAAYAWTLEETTRNRGGAGYAVTVLQRIRDEGTIATPNDDDELPVARPWKTDPADEIRARITNGSLWQPEDLDAELTAAGINGTTADQLRALVASSNGTDPDRIPFAALQDTEPDQTDD